jgi:hypothetical protein
MVFPEERAVRCLVTDGLARNRGLQMEGTRARTDSVGILLVECMDEALADLLGRRAREAIYDHLERNCLIARNEIPNRLGDFFRLLDETFGKGSKTIGKVIAKRLYAKLGWEFIEVSSYELKDYVTMVRDRLQRELPDQAKRT